MTKRKNQKQGRRCVRTAKICLIQKKFMKYIRHYLKGLNMEKYGKQLRQAEEEETGSERAIMMMGNNQRGNTELKRRRHTSNRERTKQEKLWRRTAKQTPTVKHV